MKRQQLAALTETLTVAVPRQNEAAARRLLVETAEAERARVLQQQAARAGVAPSLATVVDGRRNAPLPSVAPDGVILLEWGYVREVAAVALKALRDAGPQDSGDWKATLRILSDGVEVEDEASIPHMADVVHVVATQPYARRLEIGKTSRGDPFVLDDEDYRLVERTAQRLRAAYRQVAQIKHVYVDISTTPVGPSGRRKRADQVRNPAIEIRGWQVL